MIKLLTSISGTDFSHNYGDVVKLDKETEKRLIESGQAEAVKASSAKTQKASDKK